MAQCCVGTAGGCFLVSSTASQSPAPAQRKASPAFLTKPPSHLPCVAVSGQSSSREQPLAFRGRGRAFPLGAKGWAGTIVGRRGEVSVLRAAAGEGAAAEDEVAAGDVAEVEGDDYDPDDVAVSDESVPDDILETLAASEKLQATATEPPEFAALAYDAVLPSGSDGSAAEEAGPEAPSDEAIRRMDLKLTLLDSLFGLERGIRASSEGRAEIAELVAQLEAVNPTAYPAEESALLGGRWLLAYTSFSELLPLLAASMIPLVKVGDIVQEVDTDSMTILNAVTFIGPLTSTTFEASAAFEVRSPKRLQIKFQEGSISPPRVEDLSGSPLPSSLDLFGQTIDLGSFSQALQPLQQAAMTVAGSLSGLPPLKFQLGSGGAQSWLLTTYLDEDIRISRGDGGGLFVLIKEGSNLK